MTSPFVNDNDIWHAIGQGNVSQIEAWVRDGLNLIKWKSATGLNIYHYCVLWGNVNALHVAEAVARLCPAHTILITHCQKNHSPLIQACGLSDDKEDSYDIAFLDFFIRHIDTTHFWHLKEKTSNEDILRYLDWRKQTASGLPESIRRENNGTVLKYIDAIESMDRQAAKRYRSHMQHLHGISRSIRIYFVGYQGVGKSTLCGNMRGVNIEELTSTDLMEAFIQSIAVNLKTGERRHVSDDMGHQLALCKINREMKHQDAIDAKTETPFRKFKHLLFGPSKTEQNRTKSVRATNSSRRHTETRSQNASTMSEQKFERQREKEEKAFACAAEMTIKTADETTVHNVEEAYVSMWDFGGEELFVNTNHLFISGDAVYLLVFNLTESKDPHGQMRARITFWLKSIDSLSDKRSSRTPPVIMIGTYLDKLPGKDFEERFLQAEEIFRDIVETPGLKALARGHVIKFFPVDNTSRDMTVINEIWEAVTEAAPFQSHWKIPVPLTWLAVEREIMLRKSQNVKVLNLQEAFDIGENLECEVDDSESCVRDCLIYLHRIGVVIYLVTSASHSHVIIDPLWLVRGFRLIITVPKFQRRSPETRALLDHYNTTSEIPLKLIRLLLGQGKKSDNFSEHEEVLVMYMEKLELITRPLTKEGKTVEDIFLVPCILPAAEPEKLRHLMNDPGTTTTSTLCVVFKDVFISSPVYDKVLASCIHCFEVAELKGLNQSTCLQRGFGCFRLNPRWNMVVHCYDCIIKVTLFAEKKISAKPSEGFFVRSVLTGILNSVLTTNQQQHLVDKFEFCLDKSYQVNPGEQLVSVTDLKQSPKPVSCSGLDGELTVQRSDLDIWFVDPTKLRASDDLCLPFTSSMLDKRLNPRELCHVAKCIGTSYFLFLIEIGLNNYEIQQEDRWRHHCFRTFVTYLLVKWSYKFGSAALFRVIYEAMTKQGIPTDTLYSEIDTQTDYSSEENISSTKEQESKTDYRGSTEDDVDYRSPTEEELQMIVNLMRKSYTIFYLELGLSIEEIERAVMNYKPIEFAFVFLLKTWVNKFGCNATFRSIFKAMEEANMDHLQLRQRLSEYSVI